MIKGCDKMIATHDIHVHTHLSSCCKDEESTPQNLIKAASEKGYKLLGFADHMWNNPAYEPSNWYRPQNLEHLLKIKQEIPADTMGVKVLVGCETEYCGNGVIGISSEVAGMLDFVLVPMSHLHMRGFVLPDRDYKNIEVAKLMVGYFKEVLGLGIATCIAHPFQPLGFKDADGILNCISDDEFSECFSMAAEKGVSIEINAACFREAHGIFDDTYHDESFIRIFKIAKKCGCFFHFGSDAHSMINFRKRKDIMEMVSSQIGIEEKDILPMCRV
jgi:HisJ family histidinol phosphate phosphatase